MSFLREEGGGEGKEGGGGQILYIRIMSSNSRSRLINCSTVFSTPLAPVKTLRG